MSPKKQVARGERAAPAGRVAALRQRIGAAAALESGGESMLDETDPVAVVPRERMVLGVEFWPLERVTPYPNNPRLHTEEEVRRLADFIIQVGFLKPIEVDEAGVILTGHRRRLAALALGMPEVPVVQHTHLSEAEKRAYRVADNRLTLEGEWDEAALREEAEFMRDAGWNLEGLGFTDDEIATALAPIEEEALEGACDPDHVPEPAEEPISRPGDIWGLGRASAALWGQPGSPGGPETARRRARLPDLHRSALRDELRRREGQGGPRLRPRREPVDQGPRPHRGRRSRGGRAGAPGRHCADERARGVRRGRGGLRVRDLEDLPDLRARAGGGGAWDRC